MTHPMPPPGWYPDPFGAPQQRYFDGMTWTAQHAPPPSTVVGNTNSAHNSPTVIVTSGPNHALHLILTLLTCGLWLPVWLIVAIVGQRRVRVAVQPSNTPMVVGGIIAGLVLLGLVAQHPGVLIPLAVLASVGYLGYRAYERAVEHRAEQAKIAARADAENQAAMRGEPSGIYGQYPPLYPPSPPPPRGQA